MNVIKDSKKQAIVTAYKEGLTYSQIKSQIHASESTIKKVLEEFHIPIRKKINLPKYTCNVNYLNELDTSEKNYFVGFFSADGYNSENKNELVIELQAKDQEFLNSLNSLFDNERPMNIVTKRVHGKEYQEARICIHGKQLCDKMKEYNCPQNKTHSYSIPDFYMDNSNPYVKDFLRGYLDADGCIYHNKKEGKLKINICCNYIAGKQFSELLESALNIKAHITPKSDSICYVEIYKKEDVLKLCQWIYEDDNCLCLERKKQKYLDFINI